MGAFLLISTVTAAAQLVMHNGSLPVDKLGYSSCPTCDVQWEPSC